MSDTKRRLRIFAGPNGSGKSSLVRTLAKEFSPAGQFHLSHWINADEIELALRSGEFNFGPFWGDSDPISMFVGITAARLLNGYHPFLSRTRITGTSIICDPSTVDSYVAATVADVLRKNLLHRGESFSYETVMSHPSKIEFLQQAQAAGYLVYLYFVATRTVAINLSRIENRVQLGQHAVPEQKVIERYSRSINLLPQALKLAHRAFLFDNSGDDPLWFAEKTPDGSITLRVPQSDLPAWYLNVMEQ
jgi:predicted ABC-type ATPase